MAVLQRVVGMLGSLNFRGPGTDDSICFLSVIVTVAYPGFHFFGGGGKV